MEYAALLAAAYIVGNNTELIVTKGDYKSPLEVNSVKKRPRFQKKRIPAPLLQGKDYKVASFPT
jgi:hypothetical protein